MWQSYRMLESAGAEGLSQQQLGQRLGQGKLEARTICRNLLRRKLVVTVMKDIGRQRVTCYVAKRWQHLSHGATQYRVEKDKNDQLLGSGLKMEVKEEEETSSSRHEAAHSKKRKKKKVEKEPKAGEKKMKMERRSTGREDEEISDDDNATAKDIPPIPGVEEDESAIQISISSGFNLKEVNRKKGEKEGGGTVETFRQLRRKNTIIEAVRMNKVVDDPTKLYKMIQEQEQEEGYAAKMDKKSLLRLLKRLGRDGQVKNIKVELRHTVRGIVKMKTLHFVCNPDVSEENTIIQSAIEQAQMKFNIPPRTAAMIKEEKEFQADSVRSSVDAVLELEGAGWISIFPFFLVFIHSYFSLKPGQTKQDCVIKVW